MPAAVSPASRVEPVYDAEDPDHKVHVEETWANLRSIDDIATQPRSDGGQPWYDRGAVKYGRVVNEPDGLGSVRHVTLDYERDPPIAPHGTGAHAEGYHWAGAGTGNFMGDDNALGNGPASGSMNRGFDIHSRSGFLNRPSRASVVYEWAVRMRGTNFFMGKMMDINSSNARGAVGRFDYDAWSSNLGDGGTYDCSDELCRLYYTNKGLTPKLRGLPDRHTRIAPNITRTVAGRNLFFKQNMGFGTLAGEFSWGAGPRSWGTEQTNPFNNAAGDGTGKHMWEAGWLFHKIRITKEPQSLPYVPGRGRIEMWIGKTPGSLIKVMEYFGDVGELAEGRVLIDPTGTNELVGDLNVYSLAQRSYRGGSLLDIGIIRVWSHSRR